MINITQQRHVNPNDVSLYEEVTPTDDSTTYTRIEEDSKQHIGHPMDNSAMTNHDQTPLPLMQFWEEVSPDDGHQQPKETNIWEQVMASQQYLQQGPSGSNYYHQPYASTYRPLPPPHQMPFPEQEVLGSITSEDESVPAPRRKRRDVGKWGFAWTYSAMIAVALLNSPGPQKMERLYRFMETHFIARLEKKENGVNTRDGWRKCIRHTMAYGKQFISFSPQHSARGKLYSIDPAKVDEVLGMLRSKYDYLREDMTRPDLLDAMLAGKLQDEQWLNCEQYQSISSTGSVSETTQCKLIRQKRMRQSNNKTDVVEEDKLGLKAAHPLLCSYLSAPLQFSPYWMNHYNREYLEKYAGYPFGNVSYGQQNVLGYARDTNTPGSLSTHSSTDESEISDLGSMQASTSNLPGIDVLNSQYPQYITAHKDQFPEDFLQ